LEELSQFVGNVASKVGSVWKFAYELLDGGKLNDKGTSLGRHLRLGAGYSEKYFGGDRQLFTYCIKEVYLFDLYEKILDNHKRVDYKQLNKKNETVDYDATLTEETQAAGAACAGGACQLHV
jgi:hypothetical protein